IEFVEVLDRHRYFQVATLGSEDLRRTEYYRANAQRAMIQANGRGLEEFLQSLDMTATVRPIEALTVERSTQLINKSNQFNLTTRRRSTAEVIALAESPEWLTATVSLSDRLGDNGLISVLLGHIERDTLEIDTWVMSCRVLKRGVERLLLNHLYEEALDRRLKYIRGSYIPTAKNGLVRDHYAELGFHNVEGRSDGINAWELSVADYKPLTNFIKKA